MNKLLSNTFIVTAILTGMFVPGLSQTAFSTENSSPDTITLEGTIRDFQDTHPDFESTIGTDRDIVTTQLGDDKKPVYAHGTEGTLTTTGQANFDQWYRDVDGVNLSKKHSIELVKQADGTYKYQNNQFFPINNELWGNFKDDKNYHFTYEIHNKFTYQGGEIFTFSGDDDVWVYIDGQRVIDIGGVHNSQSQTIELDTLDLVEGETYSFDFFFAERHYRESNFTITTNIALENTNLLPIANKDTATTYIYDSVTIDVLDNDTDPDGTTKILSQVNRNIGLDGAANITIDENNQIVYQAASLPGVYSFTYTLEDEYGATSEGTVEVTVVAFAD